MEMREEIKNIVILTGAGISAESGIRTFRDQNGLWEDHDILDVASPSGYERDPELVHRFYNQRIKQLLSDEVAPNPAHFALTKLQEKFKGKMTLITQNVDNLHERANSKDVLHMHGEILKVRCTNTKKIYYREDETHIDSVCECCQEAGTLRPHIVWFGEMPMKMGLIENALSEADLFLAIGTSGVVYPAAQFVQIAKGHGAHCIEFNQDATQVSDYFDEHFIGPASKSVSEFVNQFLGDSK